MTVNFHCFSPFLTTETDLTISAENNHNYNIPLLNPLIFPQVIFYHTALLLHSVPAAYILATIEIVYFPQD